MKKNTIKKLFITLFFCFCLNSSNTALATACETSAGVNIAMGVEIGKLEGAIAAMTAALEAALTANVEVIMQATVYTDLVQMEKFIKARFNWWANNLSMSLRDLEAIPGVTLPVPSQATEEPAYKGQTTQDYAGSQQKDLIVGANIDGDALNKSAQKQQIEEFKSRKQYRPNEHGCQVDTAARYANRSRQVSKALTTGYSKDFNSIGNNNVNSKSGAGPTSLHNARWKNYIDLFCDPESNRAQSGCEAEEEKETTNMHIMPSKTFFGRDTIDLTNKDISTGVDELMFNITGYATANSVSTSALSSSVGQEDTRRLREYLAQMDAVGSLLYSMVAERAPGKEAPEIQALRQAQGITYASDKPSLYEIRQSVIENLWGPKFYNSLYEDSASITQKEIYLKAYSLIMLHDIIAKQEKISNAYAIETANMLDSMHKDTSAATASSGIK